MHRALGIIIVAEKRPGQLVWAWRKVVDVLAVVIDPDVRLTDDRRVHRARRQIFVIARWQSVLIGEGFRHLREWRRTPAGQWCWECVLWVGLRRDEKISLLIGSRVHRLVLGRARVIRPRRAVGVDDPFRQQVQHSLVFVHRLISGEQVIESAVLADDHDDVLDGRCRVAVITAALSGSRSSGYWCESIGGRCPESYTAEKSIGTYVLG